MQTTKINPILYVLVAGIITSSFISNHSSAEVIQTTIDRIVVYGNDVKIGTWDNPLQEKPLSVNVEKNQVIQIRVITTTASESNLLLHTSLAFPLVSAENAKVTARTEPGAYDVTIYPGVNSIKIEGRALSDNVFNAMRLMMPDTFRTLITIYGDLPTGTLSTGANARLTSLKDDVKASSLPSVLKKSYIARIDGVAELKDEASLQSALVAIEDDFKSANAEASKTAGLIQELKSSITAKSDRISEDILAKANKMYDDALDEYEKGRFDSANAIARQGLNLLNPSDPFSALVSPSMISQTIVVSIAALTIIAVIAIIARRKSTKHEVEVKKKPGYGQVMEEEEYGRI